MANIARRKKVSDPLDDRVKARIFGWFHNPVYISSGSEPSSHHHHAEEDDAPCLSNLLCGFLDEHDDKQDIHSFTDNESDSDQEEYDCQMYNEDFEILNKVILNYQTSDEYRNVLLGKVLKAVEIFWFVKSDESLLRRNVMAFLRSDGYNAGICKTKWETSGGLKAGSYEFIDLVQSDDPKSCRYFIHLNFINEFIIARQTSQYERLLHALPSVFVGNSDSLKEMVRIMSNGARRSLKTQGLHLPPWRKNRFMQCKWFGKYKRTVNLVGANTYSPVGECAVKCRSVGFVPLISVTTRTR